MDRRQSSKGDYVIVLANAVGFSLVAALLSWRDRFFSRQTTLPEGRRRSF